LTAEADGVLALADGRAVSWRCRLHADRNLFTWEHDAGAAAVVTACLGSGPCVAPDPELAEAYRGLYERVWLRLPDQLGPLTAGLPLPGL
jgi:hypothetical protein